MQPYDHKRIEKKWQRIWKSSRLYRTKEPKSVHSRVTATSHQSDSFGQRSHVSGQKCFVLDMFPYPSGEGLHVGHPKGYIATDVYSRMKRMQGHAILHPMGWDAFGLPAENYAIANKVHPETAVKKNIKQFKKQLEGLGFNYDWEREINTTDPNYYKWTQWIFLQMFHKGLAYRSSEPINWCPSCKTGLANEDLEDGKCERCGTAVEKKPIPQWVLRITDYADRLLADLDALDWPESIKESQRNWIGKSNGSLIRFSIFNSQFSKRETIGEVEVFTTRIDTIFSGTFVVLAPEHPFVQAQIRNPKSEILNKSEIEKYIKEATAKTEIERTDKANKTGVELKGLTAVNPATGENIPVWVSDFVIGEYGTGAVFADAHDRRDFDMAKKYGIPLKVSILPASPELSAKVKGLEECYEGEGTLFNSGQFDGLSSGEARPLITEWLKEKGLAERTTKYKLKDWVFSRQRYWGEPIPLVYCEECKKRVEMTNNQFPISKEKPKYKFTKGELLNPGWIAVPDGKLPVKLPKVASYEPTGTGESPLANIKNFVETKCPKCNGPARRETNTMPQWAGSCWYHLAYIMQGISNFQFPISKYRKAFKKWLPVDVYVGGAEHATRHLIYARFWHKFLYDTKVVSTIEPFSRLHSVGLIQASDGRKMSKRYGNVINPDEIVERFGADSLRVYEMFMGPFNQSIAWSTDSLVGARRFLERVWKVGFKIQEARIGKMKATGPASEGINLIAILHQTIKKVGDDIEGFKFNTAISALMILLNTLEKETEISSDTLKIFIKLLAPFAPHLAEEFWGNLGYAKSVHNEPWPAYNETTALNVPVTIIVQVNGKTRAHFETDRGKSEETLKIRALGLPSILKWIEGREIRKTIVVKDRLVNLVV